MPDCGATFGLPQEELPNVIVNLSDDVVVESIEVSNHEDFSASLSEITVYGSIDYPPSKWVQLGTIQGSETTMNPQNEKMIRYLKLAFRGP